VLRGRGTGAWRRWILVPTVVVLLLVAAGLGVILARPSGKPANQSPGNPTQGAQAARAQAASWIVQQVGRGEIVSCDPVMCAALLDKGFASSNLDQLGPTATDPLASGLVVATGVLRSQFGSRLTSVYAPLAIARFGYGNDEVDLRAVAPEGAPVYQAGFRRDFATRKSLGAQLLTSSSVSAEPQAKRQLTGGLVDTRLIATISFIAKAKYPIHIVTFGDPSPRADPGVPLRAVVVERDGQAPSSTAELDSLRTFLHAQQPPYLPAGTQIVRLASGRSALRIQFAAPEPPGLLGSGTPVVKNTSRL
jgi:hypothetical protein